MATVEIDIIGRDSFSGTLSNFGNIMTGIKSAIDLAGDALRAFGDFAMQGLDAVASYERMAASFETLIAKELLMTGAATDMNAALAMSGEKAEELLAWNQELAINSPFTAEGVAEALRMAMAYGFNVEEAQRLTEAMIDFAAGSGASEAAMTAIARALGQISATGKVTGGDMLQLVNAGLPVVEILAEGFNVTTAELMEMRTAGLLPATEAIEYITQYLETNFAGAAERQANTWAGLQGTFEDIAQMGLRAFFTGILDALQPLAVGISEFLQGPGMALLEFFGDFLGEAIYDSLQWFRDLQQAMEVFNFWSEAGMSPFEALEQSLIVLTHSGGPLATLAYQILQLNLPFEELSHALEVFNFWIDAGLSPIDSLQVALGILRTQVDGSPFEDIVIAIQQFIQTGETEGWGAAIRELFSGIFENFNISDRISGFVNNIVTSLGGADWTGVETTLSSVLGTVVGNVLTGLSDTVRGIDWGPLGSALLEAIGSMFMGALAGIGDAFWTWFAEEIFGESIESFWAGTQEGAGNLGRILLAILLPPSMFITFREEFAELGRNMWQGIVDGLNSIEVGITDWVRDHIVDPIKNFLGIASPSTVFAEMGRNLILGLIQGIVQMVASLPSIMLTVAGSIVQGLISGWSTAFDTFLSIIETGVGAILDLFAPVLDLFNIDLNIGGGSTGTTGGMTGDTGHTRDGGGTLTGTTTNTFNFYGTVYMNGAGPEGTYDCPSPHPIMIASSQSLLTSGVA